LASVHQRINARALAHISPYAVPSAAGVLVMVKTVRAPMRINPEMLARI
jgi:hypothetical protein